MDERQLTVCAIALFADGYSAPQIAAALNVDQERAQKLAEQGATEQAAGRMGHMAKGREPWSRDPNARKYVPGAGGHGQQRVISPPVRGHAQMDAKSITIARC